VLGSVPLGVRVAAIVIGFAAFMAIRRSVFAGVLAGEIALVAGGLVFAR